MYHLHFHFQKKNGINNNSMDMDCYEMSNVLKQVSKTCHFMSWLNSLSMACYGMSVMPRHISPQFYYFINAIHAFFQSFFHSKKNSERLSYYRLEMWTSNSIKWCKIVNNDRTLLINLVPLVGQLQQKKRQIIYTNVKEIPDKKR